MAMRIAIDPATGKPYYWHDEYKSDKEAADRFLKHTKAKPLDEPLRHVDGYDPEKP